MGIFLMKSQPRISCVRFSASGVWAGVALDSAKLSSVAFAVLRILALGTVFTIEGMVIPTLSIFDIPHLCEDIREGMNS